MSANAQVYVFALRSMQIWTEKKNKKIFWIFFSNIIEKKKFVKATFWLVNIFFYTVVVSTKNETSWSLVWHKSLNCLSRHILGQSPTKIQDLCIKHTQYILEVFKARTKSNLVKKVTFIELSELFISVSQGPFHFIKIDTGWVK